METSSSPIQLYETDITTSSNPGQTKIDKCHHSWPFSRNEIEKVRIPTDLESQESHAPRSTTLVESPSVVENQVLPSSRNIAQRIQNRIWRHNSSKNVLERWAFEIISWLVSAICMAAVVTVVAIYNNKPQPEWPLSFTLNSYVSVLSKVATAALLFPTAEALGQLKWSWFQTRSDSREMCDFEIFENASKGPLGSFMLLLRLKGRSELPLHPSKKHPKPNMSYTGRWQH